MPQVSGKIASITPVGLKTAHPNLGGWIALDGGGFMLYAREEVVGLLPGVRLRVGQACTATQTGNSSYAKNIHLTPIPFP
jgi:hypothetical protein